MNANELTFLANIEQIRLISMREVAQMRLDRLSGFVDAIYLNKLITEEREIQMRREINDVKMVLGLLIYGSPDYRVPSDSPAELTRPQARA